MIHFLPNLVPLLFETELVTLEDPAATFVELSFHDAGDVFCFHGLVSLDVAAELRDQLTAHLLDATRVAALPQNLIPARREDAAGSPPADQSSRPDDRAPGRPGLGSP